MDSEEKNPFSELHPDEIKHRLCSTQHQISLIFTIAFVLNFIFLMVMTNMELTSGGMILMLIITSVHTAVFLKVMENLVGESKLLYEALENKDKEFKP